MNFIDGFTDVFNSRELGQISALMLIVFVAILGIGFFVHTAYKRNLLP